MHHSAKEYWDSEAQGQWDEMHKAELAYLKVSRQDPSYKAKFKEFIAKQQKFDKTAKSKKWKMARNKVSDIEKASTENPISFWKYIHRLSPRSN